VLYLCAEFIPRTATVNHGEKQTVTVTIGAEYRPTATAPTFTVTHLKNSIYKVESVQRNFTKRRRGLSNLSYSDSLILRRLRIDLIWCCKILFGDFDMPVNEL